MILCVHKSLLEQYQSKDSADKIVEINLYSDSIDPLTSLHPINMGMARLMSDLGFTVLMKIDNTEDMRCVKELAEDDSTLNIAFIYPDIETYEIMCDDKLFENTKLDVIKTNDSLDVVMKKHRDANERHYKYLTSYHEFVSGVAKNDDEEATMYTENVCTVYKDREESIDENECPYHIDFDIETSHDLEKVLDFYIDKVDRDEIPDVEFKANFSRKNMDDILYTIYYLEKVVKKYSVLDRLYNKTEIIF